MSERLNTFARRLAEEPDFLSAALDDYARMEGWTEQALAAHLGCTPEALTRIALCRRPRADRFAADVDLIAGRFGADAGALAELVRRVDALQALQAAKGTSGILAAARDHEPEDEE